MIMIKVLNTMLNGRKIKNSHMLQLDWDSQSLEKSQLKELLDLKEFNVIQVLNFKHFCKLLQWSQMLHLTLKMAKSFMKMLKLENGLNSGKLLSLHYLGFHQDSIFSKSMQVMELHHYNGWVIIGVGGIFLNNSKMVQAGTHQDIDIVMTMIT